MNTTFMLFGLRLSVYWTVFFLGIVIMVIMNLFRSKKGGLRAWQSIAVTIGVVIISFMGAKILYYMEEPQQLIQNGFRFGGVSFFGSVFLVPPGMLLVAKLTKQNSFRLLDFVSPSLMLMLAVLRVGCFLSDCCGGVKLIIGESTVQFPAQITECVIDLVIMFGLLLYEKFIKCEGRLYFFIMVYYGVIRFFLEFLRDTSKDWLGMSHGQWFAIASVCIGGYMLQYFAKRDKKAAKKPIHHKK